jgi:hypothetical protein
MNKIIERFVNNCKEHGRFKKQFKFCPYCGIKLEIEKLKLIKCKCINCKNLTIIKTIYSYMGRDNKTRIPIIREGEYEDEICQINNRKICNNEYERVNGFDRIIEKANINKIRFCKSFKPGKYQFKTKIEKDI